MADAVTLHDEKLAAVHVHPHFADRTLWVVAHIEIIGPAIGGDVSAVGPEISGLAAEMELGLVAHATERTGKQLHDLLQVHDLMRDAGTGGFIQKAAGDETIEIEGAADVVVLAGRQQMSEQGAAGRDGLEAAGAPAAIEE